MTFKLVAREHLPLLRDVFFRTALITTRKCRFEDPQGEVEKVWALLESGAAQLFFDAGDWAVVYPSRKHLLPKVRLLIDYLAAALQRDGGPDRQA